MPPANHGPSGASVGTEGPEVALGVLGGEAAGAVVLVLDGEHDVGARLGGPLEEGVGVVADHVDRDRALGGEVELAARGRAAANRSPPPRGHVLSAGWMARAAASPPPTGRGPPQPEAPGAKTTGACAALC